MLPEMLLASPGCAWVIPAWGEVVGLRLKLAPDCRVCVCSLRPGQQAAAAYLCRARAGGQNLRLLAVPTEVFLPDRVAGECVSLCAPAGCAPD